MAQQSAALIVPPQRRVCPAVGDMVEKPMMRLVSVTLCRSKKLVRDYAFRAFPRIAVSNVRLLIRIAALVNE
jgi:hypothetical protein